MKKIYIFIIFIFAIASTININPQKTTAEGFYYTDQIEHLFTHCLIAYPDIAFKKENYMSKFYDADCITTTEFYKILQSLHLNNYALISINSCFEKTSNGITVKKKVKVPANKKPLILSFDDVIYDQKKMGLGMVDKIILDKNNNLATLTQTPWGIDINYNNEFVTILENFINQNPDFSINGAKGTINLTGYDGILGYRTSSKNNLNRNDEITEAKKVVNKLKSLGWTFASHSYGHYHMKKISTEKFKEELSLWKNEVEPIVGETEVYVYPYGEWEVFKDGEICEKHKLLSEYNFNLFCGVGMKTYFSYLPNKNNHKILFMDRKCIDGTTLRANSKELNNFFNPLNILDYRRPNI